MASGASCVDRTETPRTSPCSSAPSWHFGTTVRFYDPGRVAPLISYTAWLSEDEWSWLVIWELGIILQCPRGAFVLYPSALLFHFNVRVVKCKKGSQPDLNNSDELVADGTGRRGSAVWFSQSTMFSCTNEKDQHGSYPDYDEVARSCFPQKVDPKSVS